MMPAPKALLRKLTAILSLIVLIVGLVLWPARHALLPLWPGPVYEVLSKDAENGLCCTLIGWRDGHRGQFDRAPVRHRPVSLSCLELDDASIQCGYLVGLRQEPAAPLINELPDWLAATLFRVEDDPTGILVLALPGDEQLEIPLARVDRLYRPNALSVGERLTLAGERFAEALTERLLAWQGSGHVMGWAEETQ